MKKLQYAIDRIEKTGFKVKMVDIYGEVYNYSVKFMARFSLDEGEYVEVTMVEMYGENLCDYKEEIISLYEKCTHKYESFIKDNYGFNVRVNQLQ